jgi:sulfur carrier protein
MGLGAGAGPGFQRSTRGGRIHPDHAAPSCRLEALTSQGCSKEQAQLLNVRDRAVTCEHGAVKVILRNPRRELDISGPKTVINLLAQLDLNREAHLVMRDGELIPGDAALSDDDTIEVRPVISGGDS